MAETIIYNTVSDVLKVLASIVGKEIKIVSEVPNEIEKLKSKVSAIRAVLGDAQEKQTTNLEIADWLDKLEEAFYVADDLLGDFSARVSRRQVLRSRNKLLMKVRDFFSISKQFTFYQDIADQIKVITARLDDIEKENNFHLIERPIEDTKREEAHSFVPPESVIGRDADRTEIVKLLLNGDVQENVSVVAIVGIGGLGKTALAQLSYNSEEVTKHFELKMWVSVSHPFDLKLIAQKIIESSPSKVPENLAMNKLQEKHREEIAGQSATVKVLENLSMDELQEKLRKEIDGKKYLLVLDDVWNEDREKWARLRDLLMGGSRGSKILVTTRSGLVANVTGANSPYILKGLSSKESWSLFEQIAFRKGEESMNECRVGIGRKIVDKCKGVPLAIRAIGSLLYSKDTDEEWLFFGKKDLWRIAEEEDIILPILKLSYDYLPSHLKGCFAFCSFYLKDAEIDKREIIQLWNAHGLIQSMNGSGELEDVGNLYFMDLLRKSFFQDVKRNEWGNIISCKMHDLVHDVAKSAVRPKSCVVNSEGGDISEKTLHLSLDLSREIRTPIFRAHRLRTLKLNIEDVSASKMDRVLGKLERLRVLELKKWKMRSVPSKIKKMKQLRYLDLSHSRYIKTVPNFVTKLPNLQTMKLNWCTSLEELPRDIKEMVSLRHLELNRCDELSGMPRGLGELTSLVTLTRFAAESLGRLRELQSLDNLQGKLCIMKKRRWYLREERGTTTREGRNYLEAKQYLKTLELQFQFEEESDELWLESLRPHPNLKELEIWYYGGVSYPRWMMVDKIGLSSALLPNLVTIQMSHCNRCKYLPAFGQLPCLQFLTVWDMKSLEYMEENSSSNMKSGGEESCCSSSSIGISQPTFFPSLKQLTLQGLPKLKGWWRNQSESESEQQRQPLKKSLPSFPCLSQLTIRLCPNLASMPILQPCLEELCIGSVNKKVVEEKLKMTWVSPTPTPNPTTISSSSSFLPLSNLKSLELFDIKDLDEDDDMQFLQNQSWNLTDLTLSYMRELERLPVGLQHITTLTTLRIWYCEKLMGLPEWIGNLTSLERLEIRKCPKLTSLPDEMRHLTALQQLTIEDCDEMLYDRCQRETGEDWPNIAHIPTIHISRESYFDIQDYLFIEFLAIPRS